MTRNKSLTLLLLIMALLMTACATPSKQYFWGDYEESLFNYYHQPSSREALVADLSRTIARAEQREWELVPPGLYAELGMLKLEDGELDEAVSLFRLEYQTWPESRLLMRSLISNLGAEVES